MSDVKIEVSESIQGSVSNTQSLTGDVTLPPTGGVGEVDQIYTPESSNAQSGKAVAEALNILNANLDNKINTLSSAALRREIVEFGTIDSDEFLSTAETNVIYMEPSNESNLNCTYKEYMVFKDAPINLSSGNDYIYLKADGWIPGEDEPPIDVGNLNSLYFQDATIEHQETYCDDEDGAPIYAKYILTGYNTHSGSNEEYTIIVSDEDGNFFYTYEGIVLFEGKPCKFFIDTTGSYFEAVEEDNVMYSLGYNARICFNYSIIGFANKVELIGSTDINLNHYYTKTQVDTAITNKITAKIDTTYKSTSSNAQSGKAVAEAIATGLQRKLEMWQPNTEYKVGDVVVGQLLMHLQMVTNILVCRQNHISGDDMFDTVTAGDYWDYYPIVALNSSHASADDDGNLIIETYATKEELTNYVGDIENAFNELHAYAQTLVSGGATE